MAPAAANAPAKRKRNRKRRRRAASSSSSSSSSSSDSSDDEVPQQTVKAISVPQPVPQTESSSAETSESSESDSSSSEDEEKKQEVESSLPSRGRPEEKTASQAPRRFSPSPSPPPATLPSFLPSGNRSEASAAQEQELKNRFRKFWMSSVADGFRDDLEEIRKEPNLGTSRLALLIDSLASGADVFAMSSEDTAVNEMEVVLN